MNNFRFQRKITCPILPTIHLRHELLLHQFNDIIDRSTSGMGERCPSYKLILLQAPAGYGKTTLLADFARHTDLHCCWYFLDSTDAHSIPFLTVFIMSIRQCFPGFGRGLDALLTNVSASVSRFETIIDALIEAIESEISMPFLFMLCNYQEVNAFQEINDLVTYLLQKLPARCILIIESRVIPSLDLAQLLVSQKIFGIGVSQLRFTAQQIHELAQLQGREHSTLAEAEQLALVFEGWVAGILLGTRLGYQLQGNLFIPASLEQSAIFQFLSSYVVNEVFKNHEVAYQFLKDVSVLQELSPSLCAGLLMISSSDALAHLQYLERHGLFVTRSCKEAEIIFTCMSALRKLFIEELRQDAPERFTWLHQRAAELLSASNNYSQAIYHALEARAYDLAANLVIKTAEHMLNQGHCETLACWIDTFPEQEKNTYPQLLLIRANIYLRLHEYKAALLLLASIDEILQTLSRQTSSPEKDGLPVLRAEAALVRSTIMFQKREYLQSQLLCHQVLADLHTDEFNLRATASMRLGMCHILLGDFTTGITKTQKALQLWRQYPLHCQTAHGHSALAIAYSLLGNFALAEHHSARALTSWDQLQDICGQADSLIRLGIIKLRQGQFAEAERIFYQALLLVNDPPRFQHCQSHILSCLGELYQRQERYALALKKTEEALILAQQTNDQCLINDILCNLAVIYLYMEDTATAMTLISEVEPQTMSGDSIGYRQATRNLICGTIYLYRYQYNQAWLYLSESEAILGSIGLKQEHLQSLLRLASYHLTQRQMTEAVERMEAAMIIARISEGYEQLAQLEVRHLPELEQAINTLPELEQVKAWLYMEQKLQVEPEQSLAQPLFSTSLPEITVLQHKLTILALGEPVVYLSQKPVTHWRMPHALELCFYLLDCARPMRKEAIITALWPEVDERTTHRFYSTIYYLRQALGSESVIVAKGGTYMLKLDAFYHDDVGYDVVAFEGYHAKAQQALDDGNDVEAKHAYLAMINLYRGDYVQPFYGDWCTMRRENLRDAYLDARYQLAQIAWREEQLNESIMHWQQMLAIDNSLEEAHYGLMRCYTRQGKRGLALRQYKRCKHVLEQEFGAIPRTAIQNLYQRLIGSL